MKITAVKKQQHRVRYSIFIDLKYAFSLSETALLDQAIAPGQQISKERLRELKKISVEDKAYQQALNYVVLRPHSVWEITSYLKRKQLDQSIIEDITSKLVSKQLIDDAKFAKAWVENRRLLKPVSQRRIVLELRQKRVDSNIIQQAMENDTTNDLEVLRGIIDRKRRQTKYQDKLALMRYLSRQGFKYTDIKSALDKN